MKLTLNLTEELTIKVLIKEGDEFVPLEPEKEYQVTTLSFITRGGNGFSVSANRLNLSKLLYLLT